MKVKNLALLLILLMSCNQFVLANKFAVATIPSELRKDAKVVIREQKRIVTLPSIKEQIIEEQYTITILNKKGRAHADILAYYDKNSEVEIKYAHLYDAFGKKIKSMKQHQVVIRSAVTSNYEALDMSDSKMKIFSFMHSDYPYTVSYSVKKRLAQSMHIASWLPVNDLGISCEQAQYEINSDLALKVNYKSEKEPITTKGKMNTIRWDYSNIPAIKKTQLIPNLKNVLPNIQVSLSQFSVSNIKGQMNSWETLSSFFYNLNKGRNTLRPEEQKKIIAISESHKTTQEKVNALYKYMQSHTRYVSLQFGIGGLQPFNAQYVSDKGYGDCKALTNYMYSILQVAKIPSFYSLVRSGKNAMPIDASFPSDQFNHVILCVPNEKDSIWLECTSQHQSPGYLGQFTANRKALLVAQTGGSLANTQRLHYKNNSKVSTVNFKIDSLGNYEIQRQTTYQSMLQESLRYRINAWNQHKMQQDLEKRIPLKFLNLESFEHTITDGKHPKVIERIKSRTDRPSLFAKKRLYFYPTITIDKKMWYYQPFDNERNIDFKLPMGRTLIDTIYINTPKGFVTKMIPTPVSVKTQFGTFDLLIQKDPTKKNKLVVFRKLVTYGKEFKKEVYPEFLSFIKTIKKWDRTQLMISKK
jgi:hypothetical protein